MSDVVPAPGPYDLPVNEPLQVELGPEQAATFVYEPTQQSTDGFVVPTVAASKKPDSAYTVWFDGQQKFGPSPVPPTDIDDLGVTFFPAYEFYEDLEVRIENLSTSNTRTYTVQPVGYERAADSGGDDGGA